MTESCEIFPFCITRRINRRFSSTTHLLVFFVSLPVLPGSCKDWSQVAQISSNSKINKTRKTRTQAEMAPSSKKRKTTAASGSTAAMRDPAGADGAGASGMAIELLTRFEKIRKSWPKDMARLLDPSLPDVRRSELWEIMCDEGDILRQRYVGELKLVHTPPRQQTAVWPCVDATELVMQHGRDIIGRSIRCCMEHAASPNADHTTHFN